MRLGRRPLFFLVIAGIFMALLVPTPEEFRVVNITMSALAVFWFVLLAIEELASGRRQSRDGGRPT